MGPPIYLIAGEVKTQHTSLASALDAGHKKELEAFTVSINDGVHIINSNSGGDIGKKVTIENRGRGTAFIKPSNTVSPSATTEYIFSVNGTLTLQGNITLDGVNNNNSALIIINNGGTFNMGRLNMGDNIVITGNTNNSSDAPANSGGGVYVAIGAKFFMNGGTITGNTAYYGGGVCVYGGTFTMLDGKIIRNTANLSGSGGGVYVNGSSITYGIFNMGDDKNGKNIIISDNITDDVYKGSSGIFNKNNGYVQNITKQSP